MSYLDNLNSQLNRLTTQKSGIESNLRTYNQRKKDIEGLIKNLTNTVDDSYSSVNKYGTKINDEIYGAIKGSKCSSTIASAVSAGKEKSSDSDGNVGTALNSLRTELNSVNRKIGALNNDLNNVNRQISNTKSAISAEKRRIAEENARKAAERARAEAERLRKAQEEAQKKAQEALKSAFKKKK